MHKMNAKHYEDMKKEKTMAEIRKGEELCTAHIKVSSKSEFQRVRFRNSDGNFTS